MEGPTTMKKTALRLVGGVLLVGGVFILSIFSYQKISRELYLKKLLKENIVFDIPSLNLKVPILEGTDNNTLSVAAGHFEGRGSLGQGNYCIAGHNSTIYAEIFNDLDQIQIGAEMFLFDVDKIQYTYVVTEYKIVDPHEITVLDDYGDDRLTVISCTDDGEYRQVVIGKLRK